MAFSGQVGFGHLHSPRHLIHLVPWRTLCHHGISFHHTTVYADGWGLLAPREAHGQYVFRLIWLQCVRKGLVSRSCHFVTMDLLLMYCR